MTRLPADWEPAVDLSRPVDAVPAPESLSEAIMVHTGMLPDGAPHVIARRLVDGKPPMDPRAAFDRICDLILIEAQAIEFLGFADAADLLRRAVQKIRSDGA